MATDDLLIRLGLRGQAEVSRGLRKTAAETREVGDSAETAGAKAVMMGHKFQQGADHATVSLGKLVGAIGLVAGAQGMARLTAAGVKWGLSYNAQVESARLRFKLFTDDVEGLTKSIQKIDVKSQFNFADLSDAAALFGNNGIKDIPAVLQATANAAAASGKGTEGFKSIALALSQIAAKGRLSQEEINQLNEAGAPGAQRIIAKHFHLTAKQLQNLGGQGLDAKEALKALTDEWTSGRMAKAAEAQTKTLGGQWQLFTGNAQKAAGAMTLGLAHSLETDVLPAANKAVDAITKIFGQDGLSNEEKLRQARAVIVKDLGPIADDLKHKIDEADIPGHLGDAVRLALPKMAQAAGEIAPKVAQAFVEAWLHSGPWIQIASLLALAGKIGGGKGGRGGGVVGGLTNLVSKSKPLPVWVVNEAGMPGGGKSVPGKVADTAKKALPVGAAAAAAARAGTVAAAPAAADAALAFTPAALIAWLAATQGHHNLPTRGPGASSPSSSNGYAPPPGFGGAMPGQVPSVVVQVDGRTVATANARSNAKQRARN